MADVPPVRFYGDNLRRIREHVRGCDGEPAAGSARTARQMNVRRLPPGDRGIPPRLRDDFRNECECR